MTITMVVAYPKEAKFDVEYYIHKHLPSMTPIWKPFGMGASRVMVATDPKSPYAVLAEVEWPNMEAFQKARTETPPDLHQEMMEDIRKFSDKDPVVWFMEEKEIRF